MTQGVMETIRDLIVRREFTVGQQLHQEQLAAKLGVSRIPIREALKGLEAQRLVAHEPNRGYFVASLNVGQLREVYLMRRLLETEILSTAEWPDPLKLQAIRQTHSELSAATSKGAVNRAIALNRQFHFEIFALSPLSEITREVQRLWHLSEQYRAVYLSMEFARERVVAEHSQMIKALRDRDRRRLISLANQHRKAAEQQVIALLADT